VGYTARGSQGGTGGLLFAKDPTQYRTHMSMYSAIIITTRLLEFHFQNRIFFLLRFDSLIHR